MQNLTNPTSIYELRKNIPILENEDDIEIGYVLECLKDGDAELKWYENGREVEPKSIYVGYMFFDSFDSFINDLNEFVGNEEVYLSMDFATILLAVLNGGEPEDYEI